MDAAAGLSGGKSAQISFLVQQLKENKITKQELFEKLQRLQKGEQVVAVQQAGERPSAAVTQATAQPTSAAQIHSTNDSQQYQTAGSAQPISHCHVVDVDSTHALQHGGSAASGPSAPAGALQQQQMTARADGIDLRTFQQQQQAIIQAALELQQKAMQAGLAVPPVLPTLPAPAKIAVLDDSQTGSASASSSVIDATLRRAAPMSGARMARLQQSAQRRANSVSRGSVGRASLGGGESLSPSSATPMYAVNGAVSSRRTARKSLVGRGELEECTFKPEIRPAPSSSSRGPPSAVPFEERVIAWALSRREETKRMAEEAEAKELEACTFRPEINRTSKAVAQRRASGGQDVHVRLYSQSKPGHGGRPEQDYSSATRLFGGQSLNDSSAVPGSSGAAPPGRRPSLGQAPSALTPEELRLMEECTFKPRLNPNTDAMPVKSRYRDATPSSSRSRRPPPLPSGLEGATFKPRTNPLKPEAMPAAAVYVQAPIYERLARTNTRSQQERERAVAEDLERLMRERDGVGPDGTLDSTARDENGQSRRRSNSVGSDSGSASLTPEEREARRRALAEFLARQAEAEERKKEKVAALRDATTPTGQPLLCTKSIQIVEDKKLGGFLDRLTKGGIQKEQEMMKSKARLARDPECTFAPAINPSSRGLAARTVTEMSRGDALKKETAIRMLRLRAEQVDLEGITFQPHINARSRRASEGKLRVLQDPDSYIARVQREAAAAAEKARRAAIEAEQAELEECTFRPTTNDAPAYIKRIARSMALARAVKAPEAPAARPDWR